VTLYFPDTLAARMRGNMNLGLFFRLDHPDPAGVLRLWLGVGTRLMRMQLSAGEIEGTPFPYYGAGRLQSVPDLDVLINDGATRMEISLEGVSDEAQAQIDTDPPDVVGRRLHIGIALFDSDWQPTLMDIMPVQHAIADYWGMSGTVARGKEPQTRILTLSASVGQTARSRPRRATYTDAQQKFFFPTDDFCVNVARYDRGYSLAWPKFT
jgi:hypothetical protein